MEFTSRGGKVLKDRWGKGKEGEISGNECIRSKGTAGCLTLDRTLIRDSPLMSLFLTSNDKIIKLNIILGNWLKVLSQIRVLR